MSPASSASRAAAPVPAAGPGHVQAPVLPLHEAPLVTHLEPPQGSRLAADSPQVLPPSQLLAASGDPAIALPQDLLDQIVIECIHDGRVLPRRFLTCPDGERCLEDVEALYHRERDWGASLIASELAGALGLESWFHVHLARVLMDFGRFPGLTPPHASYMERYAINSPFAQWLGYEQKRDLLGDWYDRISDHMDQVLARRGLTIGVHTYDVYNESGTLRPEISILNRTLAYQQSSRMPVGLFDPLYPDRLGEFTCDRVLPSRISLHLERSGLPVALNYPYLLPEGSVEVRSQVWHFFDWVRERMVQQQPEIADDPVYHLVWRMLMDTNLRSSESQALRSYLHMFRTAPRGRKREFAAARKAYEAIRAFQLRDEGRLIDEYRFGEGRPGAIGIEVRKDLVWELDKELRPVRPRLDNARRIARLVAEAIEYYFTVDRTRRIPYNTPIRSPEPPHERARLTEPAEGRSNE